MIRIIILIIFNYKIFSCCCCRGNFMNSQDYKDSYSKSSSKSEKFNEDMKNVKNVKIPTGKKVVKKINSAIVFKKESSLERLILQAFW